MIRRAVYGAACAVLTLFMEIASADGRIQYSIFSYSEEFAAHFGSCEAAIVWNGAAETMFGGYPPKQYCRIELGVKGLAMMDERLKAKGVAEGLTDRRLVVFNTSRNTSNDDVMQNILSLSR